MKMAVALLCTTILVVVGIYIYFVILKNNECRKLTNKIPGPKCKFLFGNLFDLPRHPGRLWIWMRRANKEYYPIYSIWTGHVPTVNLLIPDDIELILSNTKHIRKNLMYNCLKPWLGTGLLTSTDIKWQHRRKILTPAFHFSILQQFIETFVEQSNLLLDSLKDECDKPFTNIVPFATQFTLGTICETAMGVRLDSKEKSQHKYVAAVHRMGEIIIQRIVRPWLYSERLYKLTKMFREERNLIKILHNFSTSVIKDREKNFKTIQHSNDFQMKRRLAMLDLLISVKNETEFIDDTGIREEVDTFMFEGHDTTAASLCFTLMLLACHKEIQDNVIQEINEVLENSDNQFTYNNLQNLRYLERVLKESLRMYPSVPLIGRITGEEIKTSTGYTIPARSYVNIHIFDLHYNPQIYPEPEKFDPDRFLPENTKKRHPYAYLPFSAGPRNCIGQRFAILELKTVVASILRKYILEPVDMPKDIILLSDLILRTSGGIKLKIRQRLQPK